MKKFLLVMIILAVSLVFYQGSAEADFGVADKVAGTHAVIPFFCDGDGLGENTLWAVGSSIAQDGHWYVFDVDSVEVWDGSAEWTQWEILPDNCETLVNTTISGTARDALCGTGTGPCLGYIAYESRGPTASPAVTNSLMGWSYMLDTSLGFAAAGIVLEIESGTTALTLNTAANAPNMPNLEENGTTNPIEASVLYPRWYLHNANAETKTNWIILTGEDAASTHLHLAGNICKEDETCFSTPTIHLTQLQVLDANDYVSAGWLPVNNAGAQVAGWAILNVTNNSGVTNTTVTIVGISHQKAQAANLLQTWDVTHEIHRVY